MYTVPPRCSAPPRSTPRLQSHRVRHLTPSSYRSTQSPFLLPFWFSSLPTANDARADRGSPLSSLPSFQRTRTVGRPPGHPERHLEPRSVAFFHRRRPPTGLACLVCPSNSVPTSSSQTCLWRGCSKLAGLLCCHRCTRSRLLLLLPPRLAVLQAAAAATSGSIAAVVVAMRCQPKLPTSSPMLLLRLWLLLHIVERSGRVQADLPPPPISPTLTPKASSLPPLLRRSRRQRRSPS